MIAAHEVLSGKKKGSREHCLRVSEILSRWLMLQGGKGRVSHTTRAEASQQVYRKMPKFTLWFRKQSAKFVEEKSIWHY